MCADLSPRAIHKHTELHGCNIPASRGNIESNRTVLYCLLEQHALTINGLIDLSPRVIHKHTEPRGCNVPASRGKMDSDRTLLYCLLGQHASTIDGLVAILLCVLTCLPGQCISNIYAYRTASPSHRRKPGQYSRLV